MEAAAPVPAEHREWVARLRYGGPTPLVSLDCLHAASNCWACPPCHSFSVRGPDYLHTKSKIPASNCLLHPLAFHVLQGPSPISHVMNHPHSPVRAALDAAILADPQHHPFIWAFNFQLDTKAHHSLVLYFVTFTSPPPGSLTQKFLDGDDAFRNARLKLLSRFPEAPRLVQMVLGERWSVFMLGKYMNCRYMREKHYMEVDVDVGSSMLTRTAVNLTSGVTRLVVTDMAFVLEGMQPDELPESILGAMTLVKLEPSLANHIDMSDIVHDDMANHKSFMPKSIAAKFVMVASSSGKGKMGNKKTKEVATEATHFIESKVVPL